MKYLAATDIAKIAKVHPTKVYRALNGEGAYILRFDSNGKPSVVQASSAPQKTLSALGVNDAQFNEQLFEGFDIDVLISHTQTVNDYQETVNRLQETVNRLQTSANDNENRRNDNDKVVYDLQKAANDAQLEVEQLRTINTENETVIKNLRMINTRLESENKHRLSRSWHKITSDSILSGFQTLNEFLRSKAVIVVTLLFALAFQVHHLAVLSARTVESDGLLVSYLFAIAAEMTALMQTIHTRKKWVLVAFAVFQAWVNVLYYCGLPLVFSQLTLSVLLAFVIWSYSDLFTSEEK